VQLFAQGRRLVDIEAKTGVQLERLYRLIQRAMSLHKDGRIFGFRAFLSFVRVKSHQREAPIKRSYFLDNKGGKMGAMGQFLTTYPEVETFLEKEIALRPLLFQPNRDGLISVRGLKDIHKAFLAQCRALGLKGTDYPLNQRQKGIRSLSKVIKHLGSRSFANAAKAAGAGHIKGSHSNFPSNPLRVVARPYQVVEIDGHLLDIRLSITSPDPFGFEQHIELSRIWVLVVIDVFTRVVLGYHLALAAEYDRYDVIRAIQNAIQPHIPIIFTIPGLGYCPNGGFPSQLFPELAYAVWDEIRLDNAKAHLAKDTLKVLRDQLGCVVHAGPAGDPDQRPFIERFFKTLSSNMSHRLPSTTTSGPEELRRLVNASNQQLALSMPLCELEQLIEAVLASLNATAHESLGGRSPLQALEYWVRDQLVPIRLLPKRMQANLCLLQTSHSGRVSGNIAKGIRPYVSFYEVRYTSSVIAERIDLIGKSVQIIYQPDDIRTIHVFEENGVEIGVLTASAQWRQSAHSLAMRRQITKFTRENRLEMDAEMDPVHVYLLYLRQQAPRRKTVATKLAAAQRVAMNTKAQELPKDSVNRAEKVLSQTDNISDEDNVPVRPRKLNIPPGFNR
jgi:transposase InsO family protein